MANEPQDPITYFSGLLEQQPALKTNKVPVYSWRKAQSKNVSARRIVLYPTKSGLPMASTVPAALCDVDQHMVAECWGGDGPQTWALMTWLIQALESQGIGTVGVPGFFWSLMGADWDTSPDSSTKGEMVSVSFYAKFAIEAMPYDDGKMGAWPTGRIDSTAAAVEEET